jgi:nitric oxide reductase subunit B
MKWQSHRYFALFALISLLGGALFGCIAATQYLFPTFLKEFAPFNHIRPIHVSMVVAWIVMGPMAVIYYYLKDEPNPASKIHFFLFLLGGILVLITLLSGLFGGREYLVFAPWISVIILAGWVTFGIGYFSKMKLRFRELPVFVWMWSIGVAFFILTFLEAHAWMVPWFGKNIIREVTVQWKSYGALVGSWNMLVYGTSLYLMTSIHADDSSVKGKLPFFLMFVGFFNLLFGWAHHTYILPTAPWIRHIAYAVSMTELVILGLIILRWTRAVIAKDHIMSCRFLASTDIWVLLNLILALAISVPAINLFTHGTHITVAHAMGTTIGINTTILLAAMYFIAPRADDRWFGIGYYTFQFSFLAFWLSLIGSGVLRSMWIFGSGGQVFSELQAESWPLFLVMTISGVGILFGLFILCTPLIRSFWTQRDTNLS